MGDMSEQAIDEGQEQWWRHLNGDCGEDPCPYCEAEEDKQKKTSRKAK